MSINARMVASRGAFRLEAHIEVDSGSTLAILGPNGAGKSTLLRAIAGLDRIDQGSIALDGQVVDDAASIFAPAHQRRIGVVFQDYALFWHMSILENVAFGPRAQGMAANRAREHAQQILNRLGIGDLAKRRPSEVSGGQAQRVALARALAPAPTNLLLDEPLAALDIETRQAVRVELQRRLEEFPGSTILVTHDPLDAMLLADQVVVLESGCIVQQGTPSELASRPATAYVAALMGVNLLPGTAEAGVVHLADGGSLHIRDGNLAGPCLAMIRPEAITISLHQPHGSARNAWPGTVAAVEALHDRVRVHVEGQPSVVAAITPAAIAELRLQRGTTIWLSVKAMEVDAYLRPSR